MNFSNLTEYLKKNYVIAISGFVVIVCVGVQFIRGEQVTRLAAEYDDLSVKRSRILKNLKNASDLETDLAELREYKTEIDNRLFLPEDLAANQRYFYQVESATGVHLANIQQIIKPLPTGKKNKKARMLAERSEFQEIIYDMGIQGTYTNVLKFLRAIEGGDAFAVLDGFSAVSAKGTNEDPEVSMRVTVNVLGKKS